MERKCQKITDSGARCDSGARWGVQLYIPVPSPGEGTSWHPVKLSTEVCDDHRDDVRGMVLADRERIVLQFTDAGFGEPDLMNMRIEFPPVEDRDIEMVAMCDRAGCTSPARYRVKHRFAEVGRRKLRCEAMTNLVVCEVHKITTLPEHTLGDAAARVGLKGWLRSQGVARPDLARTQLEFVPLFDKVPANSNRG